MEYSINELKEILFNHKEWLEGRGGIRADLRYADLSEADLRGTNLRGANLRYTDLREAYLSGADLRNTDLNEADLSGADLIGTNLRGADLRGANLRYTNLREANLRYTGLRWADLRNAYLRRADLSDAISGFDIFKHIPGVRWDILLRDNLIKVGCQEHTYENWLAFNEEDLMNMDGNYALDFYPELLLILQEEYKGTKWEVKQ
jgi:hypothetical protein